MGLIINSYSFGGYTARTTAFLVATGITDTTIANALNTMDLALIANGLDTKMQALYPFVGGTSTTHKYNFMNPADTNAAFRLAFSGGWTHSATGALPNGTTGYADTFFNPASHIASINSYHQSFYSRTNNAASVTGSIGCLIVNSYWSLFPYIFSNIYAGLMTTGYMTPSATRSDGYYANCRTASNAAAIYRNGVSQATSATASTALANLKVFIGALNDSGPTNPNYYSNREIAFASLGTGLTSADNATMNNIVTNFETALSRNV